jgi:large subunit ribosomal protein L21
MMSTRLQQAANGIEGAFAKETQNGEPTRSSLRENVAPARPVTRSQAPDAIVAGQQDELSALHGIGPATQEKLFAVGIRTFAQLAAARPEEIRSAIGPSLARLANVEEWIEQAKQRAGHDG